MPNPLSDTTIALVKASVPLLADHGTEITKAMYLKLFENDDIRQLFNHANQGENGAQVHALAGAILRYAQHIDDLGALGSLVERVAFKHVGYHILPEHYPFVADALIAAIAEILGDAATSDILAAWGEAYWFLAEILMGREAVLRHEIEAAEGGWRGWRRFVVTGKTRESEVITSFRLEPEDGRPALRHKPGQYLTLRLPLSDADVLKRNYSISSAPDGRGYRISVKREAGGQGGSRFLHDRIQIGDSLDVTPPAGDFHLPPALARPLVLLSGGVGLTPMMSMVETIADESLPVDVYFVHGALNSASRAMAERLADIAASHPNIRVSTFFSEPGAADRLGETHDAEGFITADWLAANTPLFDADIFLCGPKPFLRSLVSPLVARGVAGHQVHYEFFGPSDELLAA
ncbi:MAG: NO-inducible flavohemoprotein [Sphingopyxis sp.]|nr:NO-inducible flavohemoprotein [Sphingopyxis sp.]